MIKKLIAAHRFFVRKSQHYLNGNWAEYKPFTLRQIIYYPIAYSKFMGLTIGDILASKAVKTMRKFRFRDL